MLQFSKSVTLSLLQNAFGSAGSKHTVKALYHYFDGYKWGYHSIHGAVSLEMVGHTPKAVSKPTPKDVWFHISIAGTWQDLLKNPSKGMI